MTVMPLCLNVSAMFTLKIEHGICDEGGCFVGFFISLPYEKLSGAITTFLLCSNVNL